MAGTPVSREFVSRKIAEIKEKGVRRNTRAPVSSANPRRAVPQKQAVAIALDTARRKGYNIPKKK